MKVTMELSSIQLRLLLEALEFTFRAKLGQSNICADILVDDDFDYFTVKRDIKSIDEARVKKDSVSHVLKAAFDIISDPYNKTASEGCKIQSDMWSVIRHEMWGLQPNHTGMWDVRSQPPLQLGSEELITFTIEKGTEDETV